MDSKVCGWAKLPNEITHEILKLSLDSFEVPIMPYALDGFEFPVMLDVGGVLTWQLQKDSFFRQVYRFAWTSRSFAAQLYAACYSMTWTCPRPSRMPQPSFNSARAQAKKFIYWHRLRAALIYTRMLQQSSAKVESRDTTFLNIITNPEPKESRFFVRFTFAYEVKLIYSLMYSADGQVSLVRSHHGIWLPREGTPIPSDSGSDVLFELDGSYGFEDFADISRMIHANKSKAGRGRIIEL